MSESIPDDGGPIITPLQNDLIRLALAPPDEGLLRRYFDERRGQASGPPLTAAERRWVGVHLEGHSEWQALWAAWEETHGGAVSWEPPPRPAPRPSRRAMDRGSRPLSGYLRLAVLPRLAAAAVVLVGVYGALWLAGRVMQPATFPLAQVAGYETVLEATVRTNGAERGDTERGFAALRQARQHTLGLFPRYNQAQAQTGVEALEVAFEQTDDPFQRSEIAFFLAKGYLMLEDVDTARKWLNTVLEQQVADYREEAANLLASLGTLQ